MALVGVVVAGCYRPHERSSCEVTCPDGACPGAQVCGADHVCRGSGDETSCPPTDAPDGALTCLSSILPDIGQVCWSVTVPPTLTLPGSINTNQPAECSFVMKQLDPAKSPICVELATDLTIGGAVHATGAMPLMLIALHALTISVDASLDVASHTGGSGAGTRICAPAPGSDNEVNLALLGGGGGGGGSLQGAGGPGGGGDGLFGVAGGAGGAQSVDAPRLLEGGCAGGNGGQGAATPDNGGAAGGAVYLLAGASITIDGIVNASGAGGGGGQPEQGGGGGGAGGMIVLDAPLIAITGVVMADGGGGGGGGGTLLASDGSEPDPLLPGSGAFGGMGTPNKTQVSGDGGKGSSLFAPDGVLGTDGEGDGTGSSNAGCSGGGGGGGAGFIVRQTPLETNMVGRVSPEPSPPPP